MSTCLLKSTFVPLVARLPLVLSLGDVTEQQGGKRGMPSPVLVGDDAALHLLVVLSDADGQP